MARNFHTDPEKKPYRFIPLADRIDRKDAVGHHKMQDGRWYGWLDLTLIAKSPVHVASGLIVHRDDLASYIGVDIDPDNDDVLVLSHVRRKNQGDHRYVRYIPGTSLKGVVRSVVEAITYSCLSHIDSKKIDEVAKHHDERLDALKDTCSDETGVCPACSLFGTLGYAGRVSFRDASQVAGGGRIARRPIAHPPQPDRSQANKHRTQGIIYYTSTARNRLKGRKFYLHGEQPVDTKGKYEAIEVCKKGSHFQGRVDIEGLSDAELGLLLKSLGFPQEFLLKVGGSKPFGYGSIAARIGIKDIHLTQHPSSVYKDYDIAPGKSDEQACADILAQSLQAVQESDLLRQDAWDRLVEMMEMSLVSLDGRY